MAPKAQNNYHNHKETCRFTARFTVMFPNLTFGKSLISSVLRTKRRNHYLSGKVKTIKRRGKTGRKQKMEIFDLEYVELEVLARSKTR